LKGELQVVYQYTPNAIFMSLHAILTLMFNVQSIVPKLTLLHV